MTDTYSPRVRAAMGDNAPRDESPPTDTRTSSGGDLGTSQGPLYKARRLADVEPETVSWLWHRWIPLGMLTVIDGAPGVGKSTLMVDLAARITTGEPMPDETEGLAPSNVVILTAEDPLGPVVRPRLDAAGADTTKVHALDTVLHRDKDGNAEYVPPTIPEDLAQIEALIVDTGAVLVVVDVFTAYLSGHHDAYKDADVRRALSPLAAMAERTGAAVVMIRHPRKSGGTAQQAGGGSIAIGGATRSWLAAGFDPDDESKTRRVLAPVRTSLTKAPNSLGYSIGADGPDMPGRILWGGSVSVTADRLYEQPANAEERSKLDDATEWLGEYLSDGPVEVELVKTAATREGHSWATVQRARKLLDVTTEREGQGKKHRSVWRLNPLISSPPETGTDETSGKTPPDLGEHAPKSSPKPHSSQVRIYETSGQNGCDESNFDPFAPLTDEMFPTTETDLDGNPGRWAR